MEKHSKAMRTNEREHALHVGEAFAPAMVHVNDVLSMLTMLAGPNGNVNASIVFTLPDGMRVDMTLVTP